MKIPGSGHFRQTFYGLSSPKIKESGKILVLSDLHFQKKHLGCKDQLSTLWNNLNSSIKPDLVLLLGDYSEDDQGLVLMSDLLKSFSESALVLGVKGNHDRYHYPLRHIPRLLFKRPIQREKRNTKRLMEIFRKSNAKLLENEGSSISLKGNTLHIYGLEAGEENQPQPCDYRAQPGFNIILSHYPDRWKDSVHDWDLFLAGHTHGGLLKLGSRRFFADTKHFKRRPWGIHETPKGPVIIHEGTNPMGRRFFGAGEISVIELENGPRETYK